MKDQMLLISATLDEVTQVLGKILPFMLGHKEDYCIPTKWKTVVEPTTWKLRLRNKFLHLKNLLCMPIDGFRIKITSERSIDAILNNPDINFTQMVSYKTGAIWSPYRKATYKGLTFKLNNHYVGNRYITIDGNFYTYLYNLHNIHPFNIFECRAAVDKLCTEFGLVAEEVSIIKLGLGFNLLSEYPPQAITF